MRSTAGSHNANGTAPAGSGKRRSPDDATFGAIGTLRLLLIGTIFVPVLLGIVAGYLSYWANYAGAAAALSEAVAVAEENTTKILDTHVLVASRIDDLLAGLSDAQIRAQEYPLHQRIAQQIADLPQVAAAWVIDASGHELVSARVYPVNHDLDQSGRDDFRALQDSHNQTFIRALRARSLDRGDYQPYFTVSRRRQGADGSFQGIIVVAVSGQYFASFYNSLLGPSAQYAASVLREDGTVLARYPETAAPAAPGQGAELLAKAIAARKTAGIIATGSPFAAASSLFAYKRLASYPVYVTIGRTQASIMREWLATVGGYAAVGVPAAIGLVLLCLLALRRTRREQLALAQARDALSERAAIEAQLHQAQKMEAVGLLTAGIAHDFNNLLTIVSGNVALLDADRDAIGQKHRRFVAAAMSGCEKATALIRRLLSFAGRDPVDPQPVDVNEVVTRTAALPWRSPSDRITTEFALSGDLWPVFVEPSQIENALLNLALNARDAMAGEGKLRIATSNLRVETARAAAHAGIAMGEYVAISVADTGCGMPQAVRAKAFDPFFTTKGVGKGTGLGLSQVYGFVTRSGGHCAIDSEPGRGTTVRLYLPRYLGPPAESRAEAAPRREDEPGESRTTAAAAAGDEADLSARRSEGSR